MNLFLCKTPIQVLRAIQLSYYEIDNFKKSSICVFDTFGIAREVSNRLRQTNIFENVYFLKNNDFKKGKLNYLRSYYAKNELKNIIGELNVSSITIFNIDTYDNFAVYNRLKRNIKVYYIEDAPMIYSFKHPSKKRVLFYRCLGFKFPIFYVNNWYFSEPKFMDKINDSPATKLPAIDRKDKDFVSLINFVYDYSEDQKLNQADIVVMEESLYTDGVMKNNADYKLYKEIQERYSNTNISVKLHPRTKINRFDNNFNVLEKSSIPWEVYMLNNSMNDKIFISMACSTMISPKLLFSEENRSVLLYKILSIDAVRENGELYFDRDWEECLEKIPTMFSDKEKILVPSNSEELFNTLDSWLYCK